MHGVNSTHFDEHDIALVDVAEIRDRLSIGFIGWSNTLGADTAQRSRLGRVSCIL